MKIRKLDNGHTWQQRLREYESPNCTEESVEEGWKKISQRLDRAGRKDKLGWFAIAAGWMVLFVVIKLCFFPGNKTVERELTKTPAVHKQNNHANDSTETIQSATSIEVKHLNPGIKTTGHAPATMDSLEALHAKNESVVPLPVDSVFTNAERPVPADDMALQPGPLPTVHIEDLSDAGPLQEPVTIKSLAVKKMIRLFGTDFTKQLPPKNQKTQPSNPYTIPNNQN